MNVFPYFATQQFEGAIDEVCDKLHMYARGVFNIIVLRRFVFGIEFDSLTK